MRGAHSHADFVVGGRVQFTDTDKKLRIYNGNVGTISWLNPSTGGITATLDAAGKDGREVTWSAADFQGFRHGYARTIYKGQGKTVDWKYLYHTEHWRSAASYVALTRQMGRGKMCAALIAWRTCEEQEQKAERREQQRKLRDPFPAALVCSPMAAYRGSSCCS